MFQVFHRIAHPLEFETSGAIIEAAEAFHPLRLLGGWNLAEAHQGDANTALTESSRKFAGVVPDSADRVRSHQYMHGDSNDSDMSVRRVMTRLPSARVTWPAVTRRNASRPSW